MTTIETETWEQEANEPKSLSITDFYCPFASPANPYADDAHHGTVRWVEQFRLVPEALLPHIEATRIGLLAARFHPNAPKDALQLVSDWYIWMFLWDDLRDESMLGQTPKELVALGGRYLEILRGKEPLPEEDGLAHSFADLRDRLVSMVGTGVWMRRFVRVVQEHFDATVWESVNRARGASPDLPTYVRMRPITGGLRLDAALVEVAEGMRLPPEVRNHTNVERLTTASNNAICFFNDIVSLDKEITQGDVHNLVLILKEADNLTVPMAIERAVKMHNDEIRRFMELRSQLPSYREPIEANLQRYVETMAARTRGHLEWALGSGRYQLPSLDPANDHE
jgi:5-epi-alpha-selinene synthase